MVALALLVIGSLGLGLEVDAPPACIGALELEAWVEKEIGPFVANAHVAIRRTELGWRARIETAIRGPRCSLARELEERGPDCRALDRAFVLVVALLAEAPSRATAQRLDAPRPAERAPAPRELANDPK